MHNRIAPLFLSLFLFLSIGDKVKANREDYALCLRGKEHFLVSQLIDLHGDELVFKDETIVTLNSGGGFVNGKISGKRIKIEAADNIIFGEGVQTFFEETELHSCWYTNLLDCIATNIDCVINIKGGDYCIANNAYIKIKNSLYGDGTVSIKHFAPFSIGDNVTIEGINWDGVDKADFWMYCQPNNLTVRNCSFRNYYGKSSGIIYWSHSERDTGGLLVENCTFGRLGAIPNGKIGDMDGSSVVIRTYRCEDIVIKNNCFEDQYGEEDADAIKLEGRRYDKHFPPLIQSGDDYCYEKVNAIIEGNIFRNVPKSPIKLFASGVIVRNNRMIASRPVKNAIVRMFRGERVVVENNMAVFSESSTNIFEIWACKDVMLKENKFSSSCERASAFGSLINIEKSYNVSIDGLFISLTNSSNTDKNQALMRVSGKDISVNNSTFSVPYSYYGIYAPFEMDGLALSNCSFKVSKGIQYAFLINNATQVPTGQCVFQKCLFDLSKEKIDDATSYGAVFASKIIFKDCICNYNKSITFGAEGIEVSQSELFGVHVLNSSKIIISDCILHGNYTPITIGDLNRKSKLKIVRLFADKVELALIRFKSDAPDKMVIRNVRAYGLDEDRLFKFDSIEASKSFQQHHNMKVMAQNALR